LKCQKVSHRQIPKLFKTFHSFSKIIQGHFQFYEIQGLFKAGLEFKAGAGTLLIGGGRTASCACRVGWDQDSGSLGKGSFPARLRDEPL